MKYLTLGPSPGFSLMTPIFLPLRIFIDHETSTSGVRPTANHYGRIKGKMSLG
jgi:hypothetical protein